jgi:single-strand DNA-binding protein
MVNKVILVGRVGKDAVMRYTPGGAAQANFSMATTETWKDKAGAKQEKTEWHQIVAWQKLAEICGEYVTKGMLLYIEGKISYRQWDGKDGTKHYITEIVAGVMKMLGGGQKKEDKPQETTQQGPSVQDDSDIPF